METPDPGQLKEKVLERLEKEMAQLEDRPGAAERTDNQRSLMVSDPQPGIPGL